MKYSEIKKVKLPKCPKCGTQTELYKRADTYFIYCPQCKEGGIDIDTIPMFCTEYDISII